MTLPPVVEQALTYTGAATATIVLIGLGVTAFAAIEGVIVSLRHRRREARWLGDTRSVEEIALADLRRFYEGDRRLVIVDDLELVWRLPAVEPRHG